MRSIAIIGVKCNIYTESNILDNTSRSQIVDNTKVKTKRTIEGCHIIGPLQMVEMLEWSDSKKEWILGRNLTRKKRSKIKVSDRSFDTKC